MLRSSKNIEEHKAIEAWQNFEPLVRVWQVSQRPTSSPVGVAQIEVVPGDASASVIRVARTEIAGSHLPRFNRTKFAGPPRDGGEKRPSLCRSHRFPEPLPRLRLS